ncbi:hypothetical protein SLE2022_126340 [Rubroshorea leprosula]
MRRISDPRLWKNALNELIEQKRTVAGTEADKFGILKFSYDYLKDEKIQHCFLYCALYPEDHKIPKDEIIEYWIEEGLIEEMQTRQAMKHKGHDILKKLEDNCLLEFTEDKFKGECVRMHDLLRDMALQITRKSPRFLVKAGRELPEEHEWKEDLLKVSLMYNYIEEIPLSLPSPNCPMLTTLLLSVNKLSTIPESFFDHMLGLKILDLSHNYELHSLPNSISKLVNLTTLLLKACQQLRKIPSLSNLGALKKLDLSGTIIEELPHGIELLTNLKYLDLSQLGKSEALPKIPDGILPNLSKLQTLGVDYRMPWKMESGKLSKLENFTGRFLTNDMGIFFKSRRDCLSWYNIFVGRQTLSYDDEDRRPIGMKFIQFFDAQIFGEPNLLPSDVQKLGIKECNDVRSLNDISGFQDATNLLQCKISGCEGMKCVLSSWLNPLPSLYHLEICNMKNLNTLFEVKVAAKSAPPPTTFSSLKTIKILSCQKIKKLFSPRLLLGCLQNLEEIKVGNCRELEEIIASEEEEESRRVSKLTLPKLKTLELKRLPTLRCICSSSAVLVCDSIKEVTIMYCSDLKRVFGSWFNPFQTLERLNLQELESLKSVFDEEALALLSPAPTTTIFPLVSLSIGGCHQLKKLFSPKLLQSCLHNLETIGVQNCDEMEEIVASEEEESGRVSKLTLPKLKMLELKQLPTLRCICSSSAVLVCDSIEEVTIMYCSDLKRVFGSWFNPLQTLERLNLQELESLKYVFDEEALALLSPAPATTFFPLVSISIEGCHQLKKLFSPKLLLSCLHNLENIQVQNCEQMKEIVASEEEESGRVSKLTLPKLKTLELVQLPTLRCICSSSAVLVCDSIKKVTIMYCSDLKRVFGSWFNPFHTLERLNLWELESLKSVFDEEALALLSPAPATTIFPLVSISIGGCHQLKKLFSPKLLLSCLHNLENIQVQNCKQMKEIVASEEEESGRVSKLTLPKLKMLKLKRLPTLRCICSSSAELVCDSIEEVTIMYCSDLKRVFGSWFNPLQTLEKLNLQELESLKSVFDEEALALLSPAPATTIFPLVSISIGGCHQLKKLFSPKLLLSCLHNLENIQVQNCEQMKEIVASEEEESGKVSKLTLPKLKMLGLVWLPTLRCICSSSAVLVCDSIKEVTIMYCSDLKRVFASWFNPFQTLERLNLRELESLKSVFDEEALALLSPAPATTIFPLVSISIGGCHQLKKLFSPKLLLSCLHNLENIQVQNCKQMKEIVASEEEETGRVSKLTLPKLKMLKLKRLPTLRCICSSSAELVCDSIEEVTIMYCSDLKRVFGSWFNPLQTLERLNLQELESLKYVFDEEALALLSPAPATTIFPLVSISIGGCHQLKKLFSPKLLLSCLHNLENIQVQNCKQMKEIVASEEEESGRVSKLTLPKLKTLELMQLPTLKCICSSSAVLVCDSIEEVTIMYCSDLKRVFGSWFNPFQTLERLNLRELESLKSVFDEEALALLSPAPATTIFPLVSISIGGCHQLKKLFSPKLLLSCLHNLENIQVQNCKQMKEIVASEEEESGRVSKLTLPKLKMLKLKRLPTLRCICSSSAELVCDSIEEVTIMYCSDLKRVFGSWFNPLQTLERLNLRELESLKSVFDEEALALLSPAPATTIFPLVSISIGGCHQLKKLFSPKLLLSCLHNLENIQVQNCKQMKEIVASEEEESGRVSKLTLPKLKMLKLKQLPSLRCICSSSAELVCDSIEEVTIMYCSDLKRVFGSWFNPLQTLERLNLQELESLKSVFDEEALALLSPAPATTIFPLVSISIGGCHQLKKLFSPKLLLSCLHNLENIQVHNCKQMKEIVASEEEESGRVSKLTLPKLKMLKLKRLPTLRCICSSSAELVCGSIEEVTIMYCSDLKRVFGSWFNPLQILERLNLQELESLKSVIDEEALALLSPAPATTIFPLVSISIGGCHQLKKLFSPKLLLSCLHNLENIQVQNCKQMKEIVASEEEESGRVSKLTLPKLKMLKLKRLPSLRCICSSSAELVCDSIEEVTIMYCSDLKRVFGSWFNPLQTLERLNLQELESLKSVFDEEALALLSPAPATTIFPLVSISIGGCHQLKKLFSPKLLLSCLHNLENIQVHNCKQMKEIVASEEEESGRVSKLTLPKLKMLKLKRLPTLRCICSSSAELVCDSIEEVTIMYCSDLKRVFGSWFNPLQILERLNLQELESLKSVFDEEALALLSPAPATTIFPLVSISIGGCHQLKKLFSPKLLLSCLHNLENIQVQNCKQMKEIVASEEEESGRVSKLTLPKLKTLELKQLPTLKCICSSSAVLVCDSIEEVTIMYCSDLKRVFGSWFNPFQTLERLNLRELESLKSVFDEEALALLSPAPATTIFPLVSISIGGCHQLKKLFSPKLLLSCLHNLENIQVQNCKQMKEIVASEEEESGRVSKLTLPKLKMLKLKRLPTLRCICSSSAELVCDSIEEVTIMYCSDLKRVFGSWFNPLQTLERLNLQELESLKSVFDEEALALLSPAPATTIFPLVSISIGGCHQLKKLFSPKLLLSCLHNLENIQVRNCKQMKEIVASEEEESGRVSKLTLPKLKTLELMQLPTLKCICSSSAVLVCDSIEEVTIMYCSDLKRVFGSWFNPFQTLERLNLRELESLKSVFDEEALALLSPAPATTIFPLVSISIGGCHQLKKLFSPKLLLSCLHNLENIQVQNCKQMKEIVASEEEESGRVSKLTLPKLKMLKLKRLPTLRCICSSSAELVCDSIEEVTIMYCSDLKRVFGSWFNPLQTLERLNLRELESLKSVFDEEALALLSPAPATTIFPLVSISIGGCHQLKKLFSPKLLLSCLHNLENIQVRNCKQMKEIVASEEEESGRVSKLTLPKLKMLKLKRLPSLRCICSSSAELVCDSIEEVTIMYCSDLNRVFGSWFNPLQTLERLNLQELESLKSVFDEEALALLSPAPATTIFPLVSISIGGCHQLKKLFSPKLLLSCLHNLENIQVQNCEQMKEIVASEEEESGKVSKLTLPKLKMLGLVWLPTLRCICSSSAVLVCDSIKEVTIMYCSDLKRVFGSWFNPFQTLERLNLRELESLKSVFDEEALALLSPAPATTIFPLVSISIGGCHQLKKLFSAKFLLCCLHNLENIQVQNCKQMKEIVASEEEESGRVSKLTLPKLKTLELKQLPTLKCICSSSAVLVCDSIEEVTIMYCSDLKRVFGSWFNPLQILERLNLQELESVKSVFDEEALALLSPAPATTIFPLVSISIGGCHQLKKLFSPRSLLSCLHNLETIDIMDCAQMEEIISLGSQEEEKALQLSLPKLRKLQLKDLLALKSICSNISVLRCDSLKYLVIIRCTELKRIPLYLPQLDNGQPLPPPSLKGINVFPKEWLESLEWDHLNERDALLPFCQFLAEEPWWWWPW